MAHRVHSFTLLKQFVMQQVIEWAAYLFGFSLIRYFSIAGVAFLLVYGLFSKRLARHKIQVREARRADFLREIGHSVWASLVMVLVAVPFLLPPLRQYTLQYTAIEKYGTLYLAASVILSLILHDTYFYWMHRLLHHPALFPHAHLLHHKSTNPSPWASYAFHTFEAIAEGLVLPLLLFVLPLHTVGIGLFILSGFVINVYGHLGYEIMPRWFRHSVLFGILNTSVHHNLHHSRFKGNYGLYFRFWDRVMHTENPDYTRLYDAIQQKRFGKVRDEVKSNQPKQVRTREDAPFLI